MKRTFLASLVMATLIADPALAYIGPGAGLSAIGTLLAIVAAALLAFVGFIFYPIKRLLTGKKSVPQADESEASQQG